jgi:homocysteine S-methyltransferase
MVDKTFFNKTRILDGGMGQELLHRGLKPRGTLWSAEALIKAEYHQLVIDTHLDFIHSGAEVIVTNTFTSRKGRLIQNNCLELFETINKKAVELALRARDISKKNILIAGGLPNQKQTYSANLGDDLQEIKLRFNEQAFFLKDDIDFFYLDVMGSGIECEIALESIDKYSLPVLVGVHIKDNGKLPSGEYITQIVQNFKTNKWLGILTACVSPMAYELVKDELKKLNLPYGFKLNAFDKIPENYIVTSTDSWGTTGNPNKILGINQDLNEKQFYNVVKNFMNEGATILGGCCEIRPSHIKEISKLII